MTSIKEKELPLHFKEFNPAKMASLEMGWLLAEAVGAHKLSFNLHAQGLQEQFKLSEKAAKIVAGQLFPNAVTREPVMDTESYVRYYERLSQETGLDFNVHPQWFQNEDSASLSQVFGEVYGVPQENLLPAMETRMEACHRLRDAFENSPLPKLDGEIVFPEGSLALWEIAGKKFEDYYKGLKEAINS